MRALRKFLVEKGGFVAAEKILLTLLALGIAIVVARYVLYGSSEAADKVRKALNVQTVPTGSQ